jgi:hypothetical protein
MFRRNRYSQSLTNLAYGDHGKNSFELPIVCCNRSHLHNRACGHVSQTNPFMLANPRMGPISIANSGSGNAQSLNSCFAGQMNAHC